MAFLFVCNMFPLHMPCQKRPQWDFLLGRIVKGVQSYRGDHEMAKLARSQFFFITIEQDTPGFSRMIVLVISVL